jgi:hypothetical protein
MKTNELTGAALDWAVTKCEGFDPETLNTKTGVVYSLRYGVYTPSTDWSQGGPIIERECISVGDQTHIHEQPEHSAWYATNRKGAYGLGPTPLIAAMRCYVASKLGGEVEIPEELL